MISSRMQSRGRISVPPEICEALGLQAGDTLRYDIDGDRVFATKGASDTDEHGEDVFDAAELDPLIDAALADVGETYAAEDVFIELHARIEAGRRRMDAA